MYIQAPQNFNMFFAPSTFSELVLIDWFDSNNLNKMTILLAYMAIKLLILMIANHIMLLKQENDFMKLVIFQNVD